ncbi:MAG: hypothetical protein ACRYGM_08935 [Janthinobacterium lividum]
MSYTALVNLILAGNAVSAVALIAVKPSPFFIAALIGVYGSPSHIITALSLFVTPPLLFIICLILSVRIASHGRKWSLAFAYFPCVAAAAWQIFVDRYPAL